MPPGVRKRKYTPRLSRKMKDDRASRFSTYTNNGESPSGNDAGFSEDSDYQTGKPKRENHPGPARPPKIAEQNRGQSPPPYDIGSDLDLERELERERERERERMRERERDVELELERIRELERKREQEREMEMEMEQQKYESPRRTLAASLTPAHTTPLSSGLGSDYNLSNYRSSPVPALPTSSHASGGIVQSVASRAQAFGNYVGLWKPKTPEEIIDDLQKKLKLVENDRDLKIAALKATQESEIRRIRDERSVEVSSLRLAKSSAENAKVDINKKYEKLQKENEKRIRDWNKLVADYTNLQKTKTKVEEDKEKAEIQIRAVKNDYEMQIAKMQKRMNDHLNHLDDVQNGLNSYNVMLAPEQADKDWISHFGRLRGDVQTWAGIVASSFPAGAFETIPALTAELEEEIRIVIPDSSLSVTEIFTSMKGRKKRRYFIQGWVNVALWKYVFVPNIPKRWSSSKQSSRNKQSLPHLGTRSRGHDLWLETSTSEALKKVEEQMTYYRAPHGKGSRDDEIAYHKWRSLTLSMLSATVEDLKISPTAKEKIVDQCWQMATVLQQLQQPARPDDLEQGLNDLDLEHIRVETTRLHTGLIELFKTGIELSGQLRTQRAAFDIRFPVHQTLVLGNSSESHHDSTTYPRSMGSSAVQSPLTVDPSWMDVMDGKTETVQYVVEPAVFKSGNGNGEDYGTVGPILNATVVCTRNDAPATRSGDTAPPAIRPDDTAPPAYTEPGSQEPATLAARIQALEASNTRRPGFGSTEYNENTRTNQSSQTSYAENPPTYQSIQNDTPINTRGTNPQPPPVAQPVPRPHAFSNNPFDYQHA